MKKNLLLYLVMSLVTCGIKLFPLLIGAAIACCLLGYVIPQNKGGGVAALWVAAILLLSFILLRFVIGKDKDAV